tara:strand:+ start:1074 stop:1262 length:189 start_codon:yes stop_codon:yes gene_type:complete
LAWDDQAHRNVALITEHYLTPEAKAKVGALLSSDSAAGKTYNIADAATWADIQLAMHPEYSQ